MNKNLTIGSIIILFGCVPLPDESPSADVVTYENLEDCDDPCDVLLSFSAEAWSSHDWRRAIDNYNKLFNCSCKETRENPETIYKYLGYSYRQLNLFDSAAYVFNQGLKHTQDDIELLNYAGENAGKLGQVEKQIYYYDKIISIEENNLEVLELLSDVYREQDMYEEQINILDTWLKYDRSNRKASAEKKAAFEALGKDVSNVDKERWESEPSNIKYGLDYVRSLENAGDTEKIIKACNELLVYEKYNTDILRSLGDAYLNLYKYDDALNIYKTLVKVSPNDFDLAIEISKILINKEKYPEALEWAEKAIGISGKKGAAIFQRAEVYFEIAQNCSSNENQLSHWTNAVYEFAWQDYSAAYNIGYKQALNRKMWLEEGKIITQIGTWFQLEPKTEIKLSECPLDCYSWINRTLKKRNL